MRYMGPSYCDLSELDDEELLYLAEVVLRRFPVRLLNDLNEARERLKQNSRNSSRPPSSDTAWENERRGGDSGDESEGAKRSELGGATAAGPSKDTQRSSKEVGEKPSEDTRRAREKTRCGRIRKATNPGSHRDGGAFSQDLRSLSASLTRRRKNGLDGLRDTGSGRGVENQPGPRLSNTRHCYYEFPCRCGHVTRNERHRTAW